MVIKKCWRKIEDNRTKITWIKGDKKGDIVAVWKRDNISQKHIVLTFPKGKNKVDKFEMHPTRKKAIVKAKSYMKKYDKC